MDFHEILDKVVNWMQTSGLRLILIILLTTVALRLAKLISNKIFAPLLDKGLDGEMKKRADTLRSLIRYILRVVILVVALMVILGEFGVQLGPILAAAGIAGLAVGFGAQHLVRDVISGFFILLEDQIRVGDVVQIAGKGGLVEKVNLRMTTLRDLSGNVHFIPNGQINLVTNMTNKFSYYVFDIGVAYREDVDEVIEVIKSIDEEMRRDPNFSRDILEPIEVLGLDQFAESAVVIKARVKTRPIKQWNIGREFNRRLKKKFDELDIEIPFPHITMYIGKDKKGQSAPLNVVATREPVVGP